MRRLSPLGMLLLAHLLRPMSALGCASCFGQSDSLQAKGMNWGILAMLVVVGGMWVAFGTFFVYLARRSAKMNLAVESAAPSAPSASPAASSEVKAS